MQKILVLTDIHITDGDPIIGLDPVTRFKATLDRAIHDHPDAARLVITGDLTHHGTDAQYACVARALTDCPVPVTLLLGNHDRRAPFQRAFPDAPTDPAGFVQSTIDLPGWRLITLDTLDDPVPADHHSGWLCKDRLQYLDAALAGAGERQCVVFAHHPPFDTGFRGMDRIKLRNGDALMRLLIRHNVRMLVCGHVHRTIMAGISGLPIAMFKSTCHQQPMTLDDDHTSLSVDEPAAYGLLLLSENGVVAHSEDLLPRGPMASDLAST